METLYKMLAWLKALSFLSKVGGLLTLIPGAGMAGSIVGYVMSAIWTALTYVAKSIWFDVLHPISLIAVGLGIAWGITIGIKWDAHLVDVTRADLRQYAKAAQGAVNVEKAKANEAIEARDNAERQAKADLAANPPKPECSEQSSVAPAVPAAKSNGVRHYRSKPGGSLYTIPGLSGF